MIITSRAAHFNTACLLIPIKERTSKNCAIVLYYTDNYFVLVTCYWDNQFVLELLIAWDNQFIVSDICHFLSDVVNSLQGGYLSSDVNK